MHVWAQARSAGQQLTLEQMMMDDVELITAESVGICAPGEALIRHFFLAVHEATSAYKLSWRQQNVPMSVGTVDATFKRGKALDMLKIGHCPRRPRGPRRVRGTRPLYERYVVFNENPS